MHLRARNGSPSLASFRQPGESFRARPGHVKLGSSLLRLSSEEYIILRCNPILLNSSLIPGHHKRVYDDIPPCVCILDNTGFPRSSNHWFLLVSWYPLEAESILRWARLLRKDEVNPLLRRPWMLQYSSELRVMMHVSHHEASIALQCWLQSIDISMAQQMWIHDPGSRISMIHACYIHGISMCLLHPGM